MLYHTAILGQSGSGKSFAIARLLEELILRTRARIVILDPNGDFAHFYQAADSSIWADDEFSEVFRTIDAATYPPNQKFDNEASFKSAWQNKLFQFLVPGRRNWSPYLENTAPAAPLKLHWKWLDEERDFLLHVDPTLHPRIHQGIITCFRYINDNSEHYPQGYSLEDCEQVAESFQSKRVALASYPDAQSLDTDDWMATALQFRQLRKKYYKLWFDGLLKDQYTAPSDLTNYIYNGFRATPPWQVCVTGLAGLDTKHALLAANITLQQLWKGALSAWQRARQRAVAGDTVAPEIHTEDDDVEIDTGDPSAVSIPMTAVRYTDTRVPTFVIIDEAHNFAPKDTLSELQSRVSDKIATIAAEGRKYGLFLILATQRPQKLRPGLLSECENGCLLRLQATAERESAGASLDVPVEWVSRVKDFEAGQAIVTGRWAQGSPDVRFAPARTTLGGGGLDKIFWKEPWPFDR